MARVTRLETFRHDGFHHVLQSVEKGNRGGGRGVVLGSVLGELKKIEVVATVRVGFGPCEGGLRDHENRKSGR